ncbi:MAG: hypothetical protein Q8M03_06535 [Legionella sp.]|nr:hypothetical protein [Legionella sp.]
MKGFRFIAIGIFWVLMTTIFSVYADPVVPEDNSEPVLVQNILSIHATQANWTFSGIVTNENGERYDYFFQIERNNNRFHGLATVIDAQSKAVLIYEEGSTLIAQPELTHWQVGNMFLRFNPINNSWVFGVKNKGKKSFNFKVDMFGLSDAQLSKQQNLRPGIELLISQTGRLNGHLQIDEAGKEQFVTAKRSWFRQIWVSKPQVSRHQFTSVLCEFNDGSAFYSVTIPEADALRGSVAGWRDEEGIPHSMSQFVTVGEIKEGDWQIDVSAPKMTLSWPNLLYKINETKQLSAGVITGVKSGFCAVSKDEIEEQPLA